MVRTVGQRQAELAFQLSILFDPQSALKVFLVIDKLCGTCGPIVSDKLDEAILQVGLVDEVAESREKVSLKVIPQCL